MTSTRSRPAGDDHDKDKVPFSLVRSVEQAGSREDEHDRWEKGQTLNDPLFLLADVPFFVLTT